MIDFDPADRFLMTMTSLCMLMVALLGAMEYRNEILGTAPPVVLQRGGEFVP